MKRRPPTSNPKLARLGLRLLVPAGFGALLVGRSFGSESVFGALPLLALSLFIGHFFWRAKTLMMSKEEAYDPDRAEIGLLTMMGLAAALQIGDAPPGVGVAANQVLLVALGAAVPLPALLALPFAALALNFRQEHWIVDLTAMVAIALLAGIIRSREKGRESRLKTRMDKLRLDADHLGAPPKTDDEKRGDKKRGLSNLDEILYDYLAQVKADTGAHTAVLAVRNPAGNAVYARELVSDSDNVDYDKIQREITGNAFRWILSNKRPLSIADINDHETALGYYKGKVGVKSFIGVPVMSGEVVEGALGLDCLDGNTFTEVHDATLRMASHQVATILSQLRELGQLRREATDFRILHSFSSDLVHCRAVADVNKLVLGVVEERVRPDFAAVALFDDDGFMELTGGGSEGSPDALTGMRFNPKGGLTQWVIDSGLPLAFNERRQGKKLPLFSRKQKLPEFDSMIINPIKSDEGVAGVLCICSHTESGFNEGVKAFVATLCDQAVLGVQAIKTKLELERQATTDGLTKLCNRREFAVRLSEEMNRLNRDRRPLSMLLMDIDHFKKVNDRFGHPAGDYVLEEVAAELKRTARETDLPARHGGEEFSVLLPITDEEGARTIAERVRKGIETMELEFEGKKIPVTVSIGISQTEGLNGDTGEKLIGRADAALYEAKSRGRNRTILYSEVKDYLSWG